MVLGTTKPVNIEDEVKSSYLDYAMSVIVSRALPDVRDGLKPVQRRILYAMHGIGLTHASPYKKSARIVGEVLGKYHPHGDASIYDAMVRMAQDFSMRYVLVDGQGNFGSMDNDPPAAMRYTEARLTEIAEQMLVDIEKETVDFAPNFDDSLTEPLVLPTRLPNLLANGSSGIAVGMATNIPPHNLGEVCDAISYLIDNPEATVDELIQCIKGPDFPTGGIILGQDGIKNAYATGHGRIVVQAKANFADIPGTGRRQIVVTELPYQTNKAALVEKIAELVKDKKIEGISELRDESDRQGMRIVIELKREAQPQQVLNNLYKHTSMQSAFFVNMLALVAGQPRVLSLKEVLQYYIDFRHEIITRRSRFDLKEAKARAHILEGLKIALAHIDRVITTIRKSETADIARRNLMTGFGLTQVQAQAILDMQLRRLAAPLFVLYPGEGRHGEAGSPHVHLSALPHHYDRSGHLPPLFERRAHHFHVEPAQEAGIGGYGDDGLGARFGLHKRVVYTLCVYGLEYTFHRGEKFLEDGKPLLHGVVVGDSYGLERLDEMREPLIELHLLLHADQCLHRKSGFLARPKR